MKHFFVTKHIATTLVFILCGCFGVFSQENSLYERQIAYGINLNTQSGLIGGLSFRYAKIASERQYHSFSLEIAEIKHPKEERTPSSPTGEFFVLGKQNFFFVLRPQYGRELVLFRKAKERGVQINALAAVGPTLGLAVPYIIIYEENGFPRRQQYTTSLGSNGPVLIQGAATPFEGLPDTEFKIGGSFKLSAILEYSTSKSHVLGLETGLMIDAFPNEVVIMPLADNRSIFSSIFVNLFYGFNSYK